jgi:hypothetical protein
VNLPRIFAAIPRWVWPALIVIGVTMMAFGLLIAFGFE